MQRSTDHGMLSSSDYINTQLLHLWFKKEHRRRDKKNVRAKKQEVYCKTVSPRNGCINRVWNIIIPTGMLSWTSGDYTVSYP